MSDKVFFKCCISREEDSFSSLSWSVSLVFSTWSLAWISCKHYNINFSSYSLKMVCFFFINYWYMCYHVTRMYTFYFTCILCIVLWWDSISLWWFCSSCLTELQSNSNISTWFSNSCFFLGGTERIRTLSYFLHELVQSTCTNMLYTLYVLWFYKYPILSVFCMSYFEASSNSCNARPNVTSWASFCFISSFKKLIFSLHKKIMYFN